MKNLKIHHIILTSSFALIAILSTTFSLQKEEASSQAQSLHETFHLTISGFGRYNASRDKEIEKVTKQLRSTPNCGQCHFVLSKLYFFSDIHEAYIHHIDRAYEACPTDPAISLEHRTSRKPLTLDRVDFFLERHPKSTAVAERLAIVVDSSGELEGNLDAPFLNALPFLQSEATGDLKALMGLKSAQLLKKMEWDEPAIGTCARAIDDSRSFDMAHKGLLRRSSYYLEAFKFEEALADLKRAEDLPVTSYRDLRLDYIRPDILPMKVKVIREWKGDEAAEDFAKGQI